VTVLSRTQRFDLKRVAPDVLAAHLKKICDTEKVAIDPEGLALIARAAEGSVRDALSLLDQAIVQKGAADKKKKPEAVTAADIRDMLGLADRARVIDLFAAIAKGDAKTALTDLRDQYDRGADPALILRDLLEIGHEAARVQAMGQDIAGNGAEWSAKIRALADTQTSAQLSRLWQMLLKALDDVSRAPDPIAAVEMVVIRLGAAASLPPPEDAAKLLHAAAAAAATLGAPQSAPESAPAGPLNSFEGVVALLDENRMVDLQLAVEKYVQLSEYEPGRIVFAPAKGAPVDLPARLQRTLRDLTGFEWQVRAEAKSGVESLAARRAREQQAAMDALKAHPFVADALKAFPGAEIVEVREPAKANEEGAEVIDMDKQRDQQRKRKEG
jgi:DNA polymerase-3 subunit gamma/tau